MPNTNEIIAGLRYSLYLIFHPMNGFWDLKHEKKGNIKSAFILISMVVLIFILRNNLTGFLIKGNQYKEVNLFFDVCGIIIPFALWCISSWCITTLLEGEGTIKDIIIATAYMLVPIILLNIPMLILSRLMINEELTYYYLLDSISLIWSLFLLITGTMTLHQFSLKKTILILMLTLIGVCIIFALTILFFALVQQVINFITIFYTEVVTRR
jgi:hypothetical protein